jgi:hypothetical protein
MINVGTRRRKPASTVEDQDTSKMIVGDQVEGRQDKDILEGA